MFQNAHINVLKLKQS